MQHRGVKSQNTEIHARSPSMIFFYLQLTEKKCKVFQKLANFTPKYTRKLFDLLHSAGIKTYVAQSRSLQKNIWKMQLVVNKGKNSGLSVIV